MKKDKVVSPEKEKKVKKNTTKKNDNKKDANKKSLFEKIGGFFIGVKRETFRVKWPDVKTMVKYSIATLVFIVFFALFFYGIDVIIALVKSVINNG